ncbi:hsp70-binding protein 1 [Pararge aegeria]|uniref:Jg27171 protein n=2 Tax=Pararge aegeria TaxID=116150 RepID=A0A8S4SII9_9NEOP|nr:hsp70-binding protein 1 [Pararge aegeria]XP_039752629.1 hsp70-binding protein 1 [Pararge aegeria]CAH2268844.1 jg27171 [Pararge aegeria aegeria]
MGSNNEELPAQNEEGESVQPRQPRNLQGLLRFAMEATKAEDAPGNSELGPMDEERRKFLEEALKSLTVDVAQVIQNAIKILTDQKKMSSIQLGDALPEDVETAFNNVMEFIDDIDIANDFHKLGGFAIFPICYGSENEEVRAKASRVLAELCQNNPQCQSLALESGVLNVLLHLAITERGNTLAKCIMAISCATREFEPACKELTAQGGCEILANALRSSDSAARTKAAFLIRYLCHHHAEAKEKFIQQNLVKAIVDQIKSRRDDNSEHLLSILESLLEGLDPTILQQCRDPSLDLKNVLENHLKHPELQDDTFMEEKEYCQAILKVFSNYPQREVDNNEVDR